jgi:hypothetical protein
VVLNVRQLLAVMKKKTTVLLLKVQSQLLNQKEFASMMASFIKISRTFLLPILVTFATATMERLFVQLENA